MRQLLIWLPLLLSLAAVAPAEAATGRVIKVLPHFLDTNRLHTLSPSLYERDAYQFYLRQHPDKRSTMRFDVHWKTKGAVYGPLKLRVELRGIAEGNSPKQLVLEQPVEPGSWFSHWTAIALARDQFRDLGEVTAWRVTLWEADQMIGEQKSFLW